MHEQALWEDLRRELERIAASLGPGERLAGVTVRVGPLAHVTADGLRARWEADAAATPLARATLTLLEGPAPPDPAAAEVRIVSVVLTDDGRPPGGKEG